jgi:hypothetical protein
MDRHDHVNYDAAMHPQPAETQTPPLYGISAPGCPEAMPPDPLPALCAEFPGFRIWREITGDRTRYIARSLHAGTNPHTVVTDDLGELRDVLRAARTAQHPGASRPQ